jgi:Xaa-Pro aminopeptidase
MVLTVEPGIYISPQARDVGEEWLGTGIRIEDNVVVTRDEPQIITDALVRNPDDIETLMAG